MRIGQPERFQNMFVLLSALFHARGIRFYTPVATILICLNEIRNRKKLLHFDIIMKPNNVKLLIIMLRLTFS